MGIWAVTAYYNPKRFQSRYRNFTAFRERLPIPLLTVEWSPNGAFELREHDSDLLVTVSGGDLMWQKERLLNLGIARLPPSCDAVAWLDCDILFADDDWVPGVEAALERAPVVQLFRRVVHLAPSAASPPLFARDSLVEHWRSDGVADVGRRIRSVAFAVNGSVPAGDAVEREERRRLGARPSSGHAWAARRALLERWALYDGCICGGGDMAIALAALGRPDLFTESFPLNAHQASHYRAWAKGFAGATGGVVGMVPTTIRHLFHGLLSNRQYGSRLEWAAASGFDPAHDLLPDADGPWRWASAQRARDAWMHGYFARRAEDDETAA